jgi:hypothetical protein
MHATAEWAPGVIKWSFMDIVKTYSAVLGPWVKLGPDSWVEESLFGMVSCELDQGFKSTHCM